MSKNIYNFALFLSLYLASLHMRTGMIQQHRDCFSFVKSLFYYIFTVTIANMQWPMSILCLMQTVHLNSNRSETNTIHQLPFTVTLY